MSKLVSLSTRQANYAGSAVGDGAYTLILMGTGQPSADLQRFIDQAPADVTIVWRQTPFSHHELEAAGRAAAGLVDDHVWVIRYARDASHVIVTCMPRYVSKARIQALRALGTVNRVPVTWERRIGPVVVPL